MKNEGATDELLQLRPSYTACYKSTTTHVSEPTCNELSLTQLRRIAQPAWRLSRKCKCLFLNTA